MLVTSQIMCMLRLVKIFVLCAGISGIVGLQQNSVGSNIQVGSFLDTTSEEPETLSSTSTTSTTVTNKPTTVRSESWPETEKPDFFTYDSEVYEYFGNSSSKAVKYKFYNDGVQMSFKDIIKKWKTSEVFIKEFQRLIVDQRRRFKKQHDKWPNPLFESMPLNNETINDPWEFILKESPKIFYSETKNGRERYLSDIMAHPACDGNELTVCKYNSHDLGEMAFQQLGKLWDWNVNSIFISPKGVKQEKTDPKGTRMIYHAKYNTLCGYMKVGSDDEVRDFWKLIAETAEEKIKQNGKENTWLNTAETGSTFMWLHFRIDDSPDHVEFYKPEEEPVTVSTEKPIVTQPPVFDFDFKTTSIEIYPNETNYDINDITNGLKVEVFIKDTTDSITFQDFLDKLKTDKLFRDQFKYEIVVANKKAGYHAVHLEMPPLNSQNLDQPLNFILVETDRYNAKIRGDNRVQAEFDRFEDELTDEILCGDDTVHACAFFHRGSMVVAPKGVQGRRDGRKYTNLVAFLKNGDEQEVDAWLKLVGESFQNRLTTRGQENVWGIITRGPRWLNFRLDDEPEDNKYIEYIEMATTPTVTTVAPAPPVFDYDHAST